MFRCCSQAVCCARSAHGPFPTKLAFPTVRTPSSSAARQEQQVRPKALFAFSLEMDPPPSTELVGQKFLWMVLGFLFAVLVQALGPQA